MKKIEQSITEIKERLLLAHSLSRRAGSLALRYFLKDVEFKRKADNTPVSVADSAVEKYLIRKIAVSYPDDDIVSEESGGNRRKKSEAGKFRWIIDPIDGTSCYLKGIPFFSVLIGLESEGEAVAGVMHFPALNETYFGAPGYGAFWDSPTEKGRRITVSNSDSLGSSSFVCTSVDYFRAAGREDLFEVLSLSAASTLGIPDAYAFALVASGRADFIVEAGLQAWDIAAVKPVIEAAGGIFTDFQGIETIYSGTAVAANPGIHDAILKLTAVSPSESLTPGLQISE